MTSTNADRALVDVVEAFLIARIAAGLQEKHVHAAVDAGVSWRQLAERLKAEGIRCTASGLHKKYGTR